MPFRRFCCAIVVGLFGAACALGRSDDAFSLLRELAEQPPTSAAGIPIDSWARPLKGDAIRTLFIAPLFTMEDAVHLAQQVELDLDFAPVWDAYHLGCDEVLDLVDLERILNRWPIDGMSRPDVLERLQKQLENRHDLVVLANIDLHALPEELLGSLAVKLRAGAGLLLVRHDTDEPAKQPSPQEQFLNAFEPIDTPEAVTRGIGHELTPEWSQGLSFVKAAQIGDGRAIMLDYLGGRPYTHCLLPRLSRPLEAEPEFQDVYLSLVARAARWAVHRDPPIWVERVEYSGPKAPDEDEFPPDLPAFVLEQMKNAAAYHPHLPHTLHFNQPAPRSYSVRSRVRQPGRGAQLTLDYKRPLAKGASSYPVHVPAGPGRSYLDVWLLDNDQVVEWHTEVVTIDMWPDFQEFSFSKSALLSNDALEIAFSLAPDRTRPRPVTAFARALDPLGRLVAEAHRFVPPEGGGATLRLEFADLIAPHVKVEVYLADTTKSKPSEWELSHAAYRYARLSVHRPDTLPGIRLVAEFSDFTDYNARSLSRAVMAAGIDIGYARGDLESVFYLPGANLEVLPELTSYRPEQNHDSVRTPCLTDPSFRKIEKARIHDAVAELMPSSPVFYSLGKGNCLSDDARNLCQSPTCLALYRAALDVQYGALPELNAAWGTQFTSPDQMLPAPEAVASELGAYAPWLDFRRGMDAAFSDIHVFARNAVRDTDPRTGVGFAATPASEVYSGRDWAQLAPRLEFIAIPPDPRVVETVRSLRKPEAATGIIFPDDLRRYDPAYVRWFPWYCALHGYPLIWWGDAYGGSTSASPGIAFGPAGKPLPDFLAFSHEVDGLKAGIGDLVLSATRSPSQIALYSSQPSLYLNHVERSFNCTGPEAERAFMRLLNSMGFPFDVVSTPQALRGELAQYGLVILPMARALSDAEVEALKRFQADGGCLVADVAPGQFDEHGLPRPQPPLADVFGVKHDGPVAAASVTSGLIRLGQGKDMVQAELVGLAADASTRPVAASALGADGDTPLWLLHARGKSASLLLNHALGGGSNPMQEQALAGLGQLLKNSLLEMGVEPIIDIRRKNENLFQGECLGFEYGKAKVLALLADPEAREETQKVRLHLGDVQAVYDMRLGARILRARNLSPVAERGTATLISRLPYEVKDVVLVAPRTVLPGARLQVGIKIETKGEEPGKHLVHLGLRPIGGGNLRHYARNVVCEEGIGTTFIPLALNQQSGIYTLEARDALTGVSAQVLVGVGTDAWKGSFMPAPELPSESPQ